MPKKTAKKKKSEAKTETGKKAEMKVEAESASGAPRKLYRSRNEKVLGGVCGGVAEYTNADPTLIRLLWILFSLVYGIGILFYLIAWLIVPIYPREK